VDDGFVHEVKVEAGINENKQPAEGTKPAVVLSQEHAGNLNT